MKSLHDRAIEYIAKLTKGCPNRTERIMNPQRTFIPDVIGKHGSMHEVETLEHKFTKDFATKYLDAIKFGLPRKRRFMTLWLVIPNFEGLQDTFDDIRILVETRKGFLQMGLRA